MFACTPHRVLGSLTRQSPSPPKVQVMFVHTHFSGSQPLPEDDVCFCLHISAYHRMECICLLSRQEERQQVCWRLREDPVQGTLHAARAHGEAVVVTIYHHVS